LGSFGRSVSLLAASSQQLSSLLAPLDSVPVGHQAIVADLDETVGQDVGEEAFDEQLGREGDRVVAVGAEGDPLLFR
jgi:hypothetical protein